MSIEYINLAIAVAIGVLIGIERGWQSRNVDEGQRIAGLRTFSLIGFLGAVTGFLTNHFGIAVFITAFIILSSLIIIGYFLSTQNSNSDRGMTTEIAAIITFLLSASAVLGFPILSASGAVILVSFLGLKKKLHNWVASLEKEELIASLKLLLLSLVVLPLLPNKDYGTFGTINPFEVGWMILLIAGISFIGYLGVKLVGTHKGLGITALFGGLVSSTAVTISFSKIAKTHIQIEKTLIAGVILASAIMFPRVLLEVAAVNPHLLPSVSIPILTMFFTSLLCGALLWKSENDNNKTQQVPQLKNPFEIIPAIKFGLLLMAVMYLTQVIQSFLGKEGVYMLAFFSGIVDVDAITLSLSKMSLDSLPHTTAVYGIVISAITNSIFKFGFFMFVVKSKLSLLLLLSGLLIGLMGALSLIFI